MITAFGSNFSGLEGALIALAVIVFFIARQFTTRPVLNWLNVIAPAALLYFGVQGIDRLDSTGWLVLGLGLSLGIGLGALRGTSYRVWVNPQGQLFMRGGGLTLALWAVTIGVKVLLTVLEIQFGLGALTGLPAMSLLPGAATLAAQMLVVYLRAQDERVMGVRVS
jgi:hypothetical protein